MANVKLEVDGLKQFSKNLKKLDNELPKDLRKLLNTVADDVIDLARPLIPRRSGRAAASLKASSTQRAARIKEGGSRAPYMPWLEFGGSVGRRDSVKRPRDKGGRYLYSSLAKERPRLQKKLEGLLEEFADGVTEGMPHGE